jgi:hypothetical protein
MFMQYLEVCDDPARSLGSRPKRGPADATTGCVRLLYRYRTCNRSDGYDEPEAGVALPDVMKLAQEEVRFAVQPYLDGKIDQWYTRSDGKGSVLFLHCKTVDEGKAVLSGLPMVKVRYLDVEYIPVGPFSGLRSLTRPQSSTDGATPH